MPLRYLTRKRKEARREANGNAVHAIYDRGKALIPADYLICHQEGDPAKAEAARGNPPKLFSGAARFYPTTGEHRFKGRFKDSRGVPYEVTRSGAFVRVKQIQATSEQKG